MLFRHRRFLALAAILLLATPLLAGLVAPDGPETFVREARLPAPAPKPPKTLEAMLALPAEIDAYAKDHFGLRQKMIRFHKDLTKPVLFKENNAAIAGDSGRIYAIADDMVLQSAGRVVRRQRVVEAADLVAAMHDALQKRGVRFLVAVPPNSSTIYPDDLPKWARNPGLKTEYDLFLEEVGARGVRAIDLRPALRRARLDGPTYYIHDLHWNVRGMVAGFNAIVEADGHDDWRIIPGSAIGPLVERKGGDIARMLGVEDSVSEMTEKLMLRGKGTWENLSEGEIPDQVVTTGAAGPTVMVIGDSFTGGYFPIFLSQNVGRVVWLHHRHCDFDWGWVDRFHPDEIWWAPVERYLICAPGKYPKGLSEAAVL